MTADFAVIYEQLIHDWGNHKIEFWSAIDGDLTSAVTGKDELSARLDLWYEVVRDRFRPFEFAFHLRFGPQYEASKDFTLESLLFEVEPTITMADLAIGYDQPFLVDGVYFRWRPLVRFQAGDRISGGPTIAEQRDTIFRIAPTVGATITMGSLAETLGLKSFDLVGIGTFTFLPLEQNEFHQYFEASANAKLTENFGLTFSYKDGELAPLFKDTQEYRIGFTVEFHPEGE